MYERRTRRIPLASFPRKKSKENERRRSVDRPVFFFNRVPTRERGWGWGFVVVCEWVALDLQDGERRSGTQLPERDRFKYVSGGAFPACCWLAGDRLSSSKSPIGSLQSLCGRSIGRWFRQGKDTKCGRSSRASVYMMWGMSCLLLSKLD